MSPSCWVSPLDQCPVVTPSRCCSAIMSAHRRERRRVRAADRESLPTTTSSTSSGALSDRHCWRLNPLHPLRGAIYCVVSICLRPGASAACRLWAGYFGLLPVPSAMPPAGLLPRSARPYVSRADRSSRDPRLALHRLPRRLSCFVRMRGARPRWLASADVWSRTARLAAATVSLHRTGHGVVRAGHSASSGGLDASVAALGGPRPGSRYAHTRGRLARRRGARSRSASLRSASRALPTRSPGTDGVLSAPDRDACAVSVRIRNCVPRLGGVGAVLAGDHAYGALTTGASASILAPYCGARRSRPTSISCASTNTRYSERRHAPRLRASYRGPHQDASRPLRRRACGTLGPQAATASRAFSARFASPASSATSAPLVSRSSNAAHRRARLAQALAGLARSALLCCGRARALPSPPTSACSLASYRRTVPLLRPAQWRTPRLLAAASASLLSEALHEPQALFFGRNGEAWSAPLEAAVLSLEGGYVEHRGTHAPKPRRDGTSWQAQLVPVAARAPRFPDGASRADFYAPPESLPFPIDPVAERPLPAHDWPH